MFREVDIKVRYPQIERTDFRPFNDSDPDHSYWDDDSLVSVICNGDYGFDLGYYEGSILRVVYGKSKLSQNHRELAVEILDDEEDYRNYRVISSWFIEFPDDNNTIVDAIVLKDSLVDFIERDYRSVSTFKYNSQEEVAYACLNNFNDPIIKFILQNRKFYRQDYDVKEMIKEDWYQSLNAYDKIRFEDHELYKISDEEFKVKLLGRNLDSDYFRIKYGYWEDNKI